MQPIAMHYDNDVSVWRQSGFEWFVLRLSSDLLLKCTSNMLNMEARTYLIGSRMSRMHF